MKTQFGNIGAFSWACGQLTRGFDQMEPAIHRAVAEVAAKNPDDDRTLFVVLACPCCERTGIPVDRQGLILVTPYKGMDHSGYKIAEIDIYPPFRERDGVEEARDEQQFEEHWRTVLEKAIK